MENPESHSLVTFESLLVFRGSGGSSGHGGSQRKLLFARLRSKTRRSKARGLGFMRFRGFPWGQGLRSGPLHQKTRRFAFALSSPLR